MSLFNVMQISSTGMEAENVRLNTTASNIANANSVSSSYDETYRARHPVFATALQDAMRDQSKGAGVQVKGIVESDAPLQVEYSPNNPMADENGYIYKPNVNIAGCGHHKAYFPSRTAARSRAVTCRLNNVRITQ